MSFRRFVLVDKKNNKCILFFLINRKPVILIGNKSDLSDQRRVQKDEGLMLAKDMNASFIETSARVGEVSLIFNFLNYFQSKLGLCQH